MATHRLIIMRHAEAAGSGPSDRERPLTPAGVSSAAEVGTWLVEQGPPPSGVLVSSALRTRQTWDAIVSATGWDLTPEFSEQLYVAGPENLLQLIRECDDDVESVLIIAHNPTVAFLSHDLADGTGLDQELAAGGFAPATTLVFDIDGPWSELGADGATISAYRSGR